MLISTLRRLRRLARYFWGSLAVVVIVLAVVVSLGRKMLPMAHEYRAEIAAFASRQLGVQVQIGAIEAVRRESGFEAIDERRQIAFGFGHRQAAGRPPPSPGEV